MKNDDASNNTRYSNNYERTSAKRIELCYHNLGYKEFSKCKAKRSNEYALI